ncbi:MAG: cyclic nucleotide-binding domain-containing protein [Gammaproteobacteria bacterium]|nr:cyclic nucleotide-binding domain-containing protein [Gammaproteobacteria bacterium]
MSNNNVIQEILSHPEFVEGEFWSREKYAENAEIIKQGEASNSLYYLQSGVVRVLGRVEIDDKRQVSPGVCDIQGGELFGELVLFDDGPRSASVVAVTKAEVIAINGEKLMEFLEREPDLGFRFMKYMMVKMVGRLRNTNSKIFSLFAWGLKAHNVEQHL